MRGTILSLSVMPDLFYLPLSGREGLGSGDGPSLPAAPVSSAPSPTDQGRVGAPAGAGAPHPARQLPRAPPRRPTSSLASGQPASPAPPLAATASVGGPAAVDTVAASALAASNAALRDTLRGRGHTAGRGGLAVNVGPSRDIPAPDSTIADIRVIRDGLLGFSTAKDKKGLRALVRRAIKDFLDRGETISRQADASLLRAVEFLELKAPMLARCDVSWGAFNLLSRSL